ncbi:MAG: Cks1bp [Marteilia pararefringens]
MTGETDKIFYSVKYYDDMYEYRHVVLSSDISKRLPRNNLMTETEWRNIGVQQSIGWKNYMKYSPENYVVLFRKLRVREE